MLLVSYCDDADKQMPLWEGERRACVHLRWKYGGVSLLYVASPALAQLVQSMYVPYVSRPLLNIALHYSTANSFCLTKFCYFVCFSAYFLVNKVPLDSVC